LKKGVEKQEFALGFARPRSREVAGDEGGNEVLVCETSDKPLENLGRHPNTLCSVDQCATATG
jgi:hypothetical protein